MLLPLDGSKLAEEILPYAIEVAAVLKSSVVVLNVTGLVDPEITMHQAYVKSVVENILNELEHVIIRTKGNPSEAIKVSGEVRTGHPAEEIIKYANESDIDFIMLSAYGQSGARQWALGGTTEKVTRSSRVPVWVVRSRDSNNKKYVSWPIKNILVPLDASSLGECVVPFIKEMAGLTRTKKADITLFNVNEPVLINADYPEMIMPLTWNEHVKQQNIWLEKISLEYLNNIKRKLEDIGLTVNIEIAFGNPAEAILNYAGNKSVDLIILATHGRTGIARVDYGNVADKVLHRSRVPIFLVRPEICYFE